MATQTVGRSLRARGTYCIYRGLGEAMARLPLPVANAAAVAVGEALYRTRPATREASIRNLRRVLASDGRPVDPAVLEQTCRQAFHEYGRYWAEGALLPRLSVGEIARRMVVAEGMDHLARASAAGRGVVMALPHVGSWEWGGAFLASAGFPMTSVAERVEPQELFEWFIEQRRAMGLTIVPLDGDTGILLRTLRAGGLVGLLCDRDIQGNGVEVELFGEKTTLPAGPATLALRTGAALVVAVVYSGPGRGHTGMVSAPLDVARTGRLRDDVVRVTQDVAHHLEECIRRAPEQWHLFQPNWPSDQVGLSA